MKKGRLLIKLCAGLMALLVINWGIRELFDPSFYYGHNILEYKMKQFESRPEQYNTVMIGSSSIFMNMDPEIFDANQPKEWNILSYNFGSGSTLPPETYMFLDGLLDQYGNRIEVVLIELRDLCHYPDYHRNTLRKRYWLTPSWFAFILRANLDSHIAASERTKSIQRYGISLLERMFNVNYFSDLFATPNELVQKRETRMKELQQNMRQGYIPTTPEDACARQNKFIADTTFLVSSTQTYKTLIAGRKQAPVNNAHLNHVLWIINRCNELGIHCVFLSHPKQILFQLEEAFAMAQHIPSLHLIDLTDPNKYPELFLSENTMDNSHYNIQGTQILTTLAAQKFRHIHGQWLEEMGNGK
jgi:hypothetical protein